MQNILTFDDRYASVRAIRLEENFRSSKGIVELGRSVAERLDSVERLPKKMIAAGHQTWERGDMLTLQFENPSEEAQWIVERIVELQGIPFTDRPGSEPRGLSWSDCAVLFRSVKDADDLVDELKRRNIPFIVKACALLTRSRSRRVGLFHTCLTRPPPRTQGLWDAAKLIPDASKWSAAMRAPTTVQTSREHPVACTTSSALPQSFEVLDLRKYIRRRRAYASGKSRKIPTRTIRFSSPNQVQSFVISRLAPRL